MRRARIRCCTTLVLILVSVTNVAADELRRAGWREDFRTLPPEWEVRRKPGTNVTEFRVGPPTDEHDGVLVVTASDATGMFATSLEGVDLRRTPILRWRWRATVLPSGADGRIAERDDQAITVFVSTGNVLRQKSVAYRWETDTPVGSEGEASYAAGIIKAKWIALRNAKDAGYFFVEERNVARDFERAFGFVPEEINIGVTSNSQYTGTSAAAELDWIELVAAPAPPGGEAEAP